MIENIKAAIIGCGFVGSASGFALMMSGLFRTIVLIDANKDRAIGEAMDIGHGVPFAKQVNVYAGDYDDIKDASIVIITAGAAQKEGESRLDLIEKNVLIYQDIIPRIANAGFNGVLLIVSNPVDILTYVTSCLMGQEKYGIAQHKIIGSGTVLDTARLKYILGARLKVDSRSVHAYVLGEHGDSEIIAWSSANIAGVPIDAFCKCISEGTFIENACQAPSTPTPNSTYMPNFLKRRNDNTCNGCSEEKEKILYEVRNSAYEIIKRKQATYYGIAMSVKRICEAVIGDEKAILPVSTVLNGEINSIAGVALSTPCIIGKDGVISHLPISLSPDELSALKKSAGQLSAITRKLNL